MKIVQLNRALPITAVAVSLLAVAGKGGHILLQDQLYGGTLVLARKYFDNWGLEYDFFDGKRLLICDLEDAAGYLIAVDVVDAGVGDRVLILDEGTGARQIFDVDRGPIRSVVVGIVDDY